MQELWKPIEGFENYLVSNLGRIQGPKSILKAQPDRDGYRKVKLHVNGKAYFKGINRLVCEAFNGPAPEGMHALHKDNIRHHDYPSNLYWGTPQNNSDDMVNSGRSRSNENHPLAVMDWNKVHEIRKLYKQYASIKWLASTYKVTTTCIGNIVHNKTWKDPDYDKTR